MIKIALQILLISLPLLCFGQSSKEYYTVLGTTKRLPLKNAKVYSYQGNGCSMGGLTLESTDDSVFSVASSVIGAVFDLGNGQTIVAKDINKEIFYAYTSLEKVFVSKGDTLSKGALLGLAYFNVNSKFILMITNSRGINLNDERVWEILNEDCSETLNQEYEKAHTYY